MTEAELRQLLARPEVEGLECKASVLNRRDLAEYAVGIGNAGGGFVIMGATNRLPRSIVPMTVPSPEELARTCDSVANSANVHIQLEVVATSDGSVLVAHIPSHPRGVPFYTNDGKYLIRLGEQLRGMTLEEIEAIRREGGADFTALPLQDPPAELISAVGLEELRRLMTEAGAAPDLVALSDSDLLRSLGVLGSNGRLLIAGLVLVGKPEAIRTHLPFAQWQFRRMLSDTDYDQAEDVFDPLPVALRRLREWVAASNPIVTIPGWLVHPEFPRYPTLALRELIVNALCHRDYAVHGTVALKLYPDRLELSNPGGFVGGITPENILHHPSTARNPVLFQALTRMRLANASNLGVPRVYRDLLSEGKEPPIYWTSGQTVRVTIKGQDARREFIELVHQHSGLDVDHLLVLHYLTRHREVTARTVADLCHRPLEEARERLGQLVTQWKLLEAGGSGTGRYYRLSQSTYTGLIGTLSYRVDQRLTQENVKARILSALRQGPLSNQEIREITQMGRNQVTWIMQALQTEGLVRLEGHGRGSRWRLVERAP